MQILVDTSVLIRTAKPDDPNCQIAEDALAALASKGHHLVIAAQCLYEFYVVATRPTTNNGLGQTALEAVSDLIELKSLYRLLPSNAPSELERWLEIVAAFRVQGKTAHDARLVAVMLENGIADVLTFNVSDFRRYEPRTVVVHDPVVVAQRSSPDT